jgi:tetratricopeptide (TPR) repeat protein
MRIWTSLTFNIIILTQIIIGSLRVDAKTSLLKSGIRHYAKGEFEKAAQELHNALNSKPGKTDRAKIHKYIGLSLYTLGRQAEASENFKRCLSVSMSCNIDKKEALDESVLPFFQDLKKRFEEQKSALKPKTKILVKSPVKDAEILIDGTLMGNTNESLEAEPGTWKVVVRCKGYKTKRANIIINKLVENVYEIDLERADRKSVRKEAGKDPHTDDASRDKG